MNYKGWPGCCRLSNGIIEVVATTVVGPRIVHLSQIGRNNIFHENPGDLGKAGGPGWRHYSGHRFWHAPELKPRTYYPDNNPVKVQQSENFVRLIQPVEVPNGIQKEIDIRIDNDALHVTVVHRLRNMNAWGIEIAAWAITDMGHGGVGILPLPDRGIHDPDIFYPPHNLVLWDYTDMSDPRFTWGKRYIMLRDNERSSSHQKVGIESLSGWVGYAVDNQLFLKKFKHHIGAAYHEGCSAVLFTNPSQSQIETVGPLTKLQPNGELEHVEEWFLYDNIPLPSNDADIDTFILPRIKE
jgi:hypothetical protein